MQWFHLFQYLLTILNYLSHLREILDYLIYLREISVNRG